MEAQFSRCLRCSQDIEPSPIFKGGEFWLYHRDFEKDKLQNNKPQISFKRQASVRFKLQASLTWVFLKVPKTHSVDNSLGVFPQHTFEDIISFNIQIIPCITMLFNTIKNLSLINLLGWARFTLIKLYLLPTTWCVIVLQS